MIYEKTAHGTNRLWLKHHELPKERKDKYAVNTFLDLLSIWYGYDKKTNEYISWEFSIAMPGHLIENALLRLNCNLEKSAEAK
jgi:hypothetical protein